MMTNETRDGINTGCEDIREIFSVMHRVSGGVLVMSIVTVHALMSAIGRPLKDETYTDMAMCLNYLEQLQQGRDSTCLLCDFEFVFNRSAPPAAIVIVRPEYAALMQSPETTGVVNAICPVCAAANDLQARVVAYYDTNIVRIARTVPWVEPKDDHARLH